MRWPSRSADRPSAGAEAASRLPWYHHPTAPSPTMEVRTVPELQTASVLVQPPSTHTRAVVEALPSVPQKSVRVTSR